MMKPDYDADSRFPWWQAGLCLLVTLGLVALVLGLAWIGNKAMGQDGPRALVSEEDDYDDPARLSELGYRLFYDKALSRTGTVSCSTCHDPKKGYSSGGLPPALGGGRLTRKAPSIFNRYQGKAFFWDGRATSLEEQALGPINNPDEMGGTAAEAVARLKASEEYRTRFGALFADGITEANLAKALASFERSLVTAPVRLDHHLAGREGGLSAQEARGWDLFRGKAQCYKCHSGDNLTDEGFHNTGLGYDPRRREWRDEGRSAVTGLDRHRGQFKTPGLRGCRRTAPYMHDCSLETLHDVVDFYNRGGLPNPNLDRDIRPLGLTPREEQDLVVFLKSL